MQNCSHVSLAICSSEYNIFNITKKKKTTNLQKYWSRIHTFKNETYYNKYGHSFLYRYTVSRKQFQYPEDKNPILSFNITPISPSPHITNPHPMHFSLNQIMLWHIASTTAVSCYTLHALEQTPCSRTQLWCYYAASAQCATLPNIHTQQCSPIWKCPLPSRQMASQLLNSCCPHKTYVIGE